jgi:hypothetical protein
MPRRQDPSGRPRSPPCGLPTRCGLVRADCGLLDVRSKKPRTLLTARSRFHSPRSLLKCPLALGTPSGLPRPRFSPSYNNLTVGTAPVDKCTAPTYEDWSSRPGEMRAALAELCWRACFRPLEVLEPPGSMLGPLARSLESDIRTGTRLL